MAIPVYLQKYKAAGIYRITFDKSTILGVDAEILRLVVGYSERGPFNTPVYITSPTEFTAIFGKASRKLEKRGVFFHRLAQQALQAGPILALNLKVFEGEVVGALGFNPVNLCVHGTDNHAAELNNAYKAYENAGKAYESALADFRAEKNDVTEADVTEAANAYAAAELAYNDLKISVHKDCGNFVSNVQYLSLPDIYDTTRFWKLDEKQLDSVRIVRTKADSDVPSAFINEDGTVAYTAKSLDGYIRIAATNVASLSNTFIFRKTVDSATLNAYNITVRDWFSDDSEGVPEYLEGYEDVKVSEFLVDMYVFRGKFTSSVTSTDSLGNYIAYAPSQYVDYTTTADDIRLLPYVENAFGDKLDTLDQLYYDSRSNAIAKYTGFTLPYFMDKTGAYQSLDILFNQDNDTHFMMMYFDVTALENGTITPADIIAPSAKVSSETAAADYAAIVEAREAASLVETVKGSSAWSRLKALGNAPERESWWTDEIIKDWDENKPVQPNVPDTVRPTQVNRDDYSDDETYNKAV